MLKKLQQKKVENRFLLKLQKENNSQNMLLMICLKIELNIVI